MAKRRRIIQNFKNTEDLDLNESDEFIFGKYETEGIGPLNRMSDTVSSARGTQAAQTFYRQYHSIVDHPHLTHRAVSVIRISVNELDEWIATGLLKKTDAAFEPDPHMRETLKHFRKFIASTGK